MLQDYIFRGRKFTVEEIEMIKEIIKKNPQISKTKIAKIICEAINWRQDNGLLKVIPLSEALKRMEKIGLITLPQRKKSGGYWRKTIWKEKTELAIPEEKIQQLNFNDIELKMVRWTEKEKLWNYLIDKYHYLGYRTPVGHHLKYLIFSSGKVLGCIGFADGVLKLNLRDKWIGWNVEEKNRNLKLIINNNRFLILPWIKVKNLASKVLSIATKMVPKDWERIYKYKPVLIETFVDVSRFKGTCYKAANWIYLGRTKGKGRRGLKYYIHNQPKDVYVYPLCGDYLKLLRCK